MENENLNEAEAAISSNGVLADVAFVKAKHPLAEVNRDGAMFFCHEGKKDLGAGFSKDAAWRSAVCNIR